METPLWIWEIRLQELFFAYPELYSRYLDEKWGTPKELREWVLYGKRYGG